MPLTPRLVKGQLYTALIREVRNQGSDRPGVRACVCRWAHTTARREIRLRWVACSSGGGVGEASGGVGTKVTQAVEPRGLLCAGRPHTAPSRHLSTFAGKPMCSQVSDSDPPSSGEKHCGSFFPHHPEVPGGDRTRGEGSFQQPASRKVILGL